MSDRSRLELAIWGAAVIAGSAIGGTLALRAEPASSSGLATSPPSSAAPASSSAPRAPAVPLPTSPSMAAPSSPPAVAVPSVPGVQTASPPAPSSDLRIAAVAQIKDALTRFVAWSHAHPGARCPDAATLGVAVDPWGDPLRITCTDQPADQIAGVVSAGPDGVAGTRDDVASWTLGADVLDPIRGPRWSPNRTSRRTGAKPTPRPPAGSAAGSNDSDGDGIPDRR